MNIVRKLNGTTLELCLDDRLDTLTAPELDAEFEKGLEGVETLILNFADLEYITSAGLRSLLGARRLMHGKGSMKVINANEMIQEVFSMTGLEFLLGDE